MQNQQLHTQDTTQTLVSFIVPVYNVPADMLCQCIESIKRLSLRKAERQIIVVDDGSTNHPLDSLANYVDDIIYIRQSNQGVSVARNTGLSIATGTFVQFIDGDDMLLQTPYEHVIDLTRYGDTDLVMYDFTESNEGGIDFDDQGPMTGTEFMRKQNIHGSVWGFIFRRSILGSLRFTPGISYGEDEEFTPQLMLRAERVIKTNAKAYYYRTRPASAINMTDMRSRLKRLNDAKNVIFSLQRKADTMPTNDRSAMQRRVAQLTMDYIYNIIILTQSRHYLDRCLNELRNNGLFPLPDEDYTTKYKWFRRMTNSNVGLAMLFRTLPFMNKER